MTARLTLQSDERERSEYVARWAAAGGKDAELFADWVRVTQGAMQNRNLAERVRDGLEGLWAIAEIYHRNTGYGNDEWYEEREAVYHALESALSLRVGHGIGSVDRMAWAQACVSTSMTGVDRACAAIDAALEMWREDVIATEVMEAMQSLYRWGELSGLLALRKIDAESLDDIRATKGRVKQRNEAKGMVKKLERYEDAELPPVVDRWFRERLDYWRTQLAILSMPE